ncbi:hypothetical protein [Cellulomonas sp. Leaf334]|uniref:hypothetical protein n=1 Tax=Cellulomonas sp. Leaf334 TaxID=1736339 RepID=UPI0007007AAC|nr:hypothetical protein [Cellulomonas sp. Leaf334]KQR16679.1 hypothetical protein ASF78_04775 [Cellulomonas sp. Leaf334]
MHVTDDALTVARPAALPGASGGPGARRGRGILVGLLVAGVVVALRAVGVLEHAAAAVVLVALTLAVPTSRDLARRVLLAGCLALGWVPVLWWLPGPVGTLGRATVILAALAGTLAGVAAGAIDPVARLRSYVPRWRAVDVLPVGSAAVTVWVLAPWFRVPSAESALAMLATGWDHSAHAGITQSLRQHGVVIGQLGAAPGGEHWAYAHYPQGFHAVAATLLELVSPVRVSAAADLVDYTRVMATVAVVCVTVVVAGVCALPGLRRRPWAAAVVAIVTWSALVLGPGGGMLSEGFPNFLVAALMLAALPLVLVPAARIILPVHAAAAGGAVVAVAHNWTLLLCLAAPLALAVLLPWGRARRRGGRAASWCTATLALATLAATAYGVAVIGGQQVGAILVVDGGISPASLRLTALLTGASVVVAVVLLVLRRRGARSTVSLRSAASMLVVIVGLAAAAGIAALQISADGSLGYYFWKFTRALQLLSVVLLAVGAAALFSTVRAARSRPARAGRAFAGAAVVAVALFGWGGVHPALPAVGPDAAPGFAARGSLAEASAHPPLTARLLLDAADAALPSGWSHPVYLSFPAAGGVHPVAAAQWFYALTGAWTDEGNATAGLLGVDEQTPARAVEVARGVCSPPTRWPSWSSAPTSSSPSGRGSPATGSRTASSAGDGRAGPRAGQGTVTVRQPICGLVPAVALMP